MLPGSCTDSHSREVQMLFYTIILSIKILKGKKKMSHWKQDTGQPREKNQLQESFIIYTTYIFLSQPEIMPLVIETAHHR